MCLMVCFEMWNTLACGMVGAVSQNPIENVHMKIPSISKVHILQFQEPYAEVPLIFLLSPHFISYWLRLSISMKQSGMNGIACKCLLIMNACVDPCVCIDE